MPEELRQLDREILDYLAHRRGTPAWFAHVCGYAMAAQDYAFLTGTVTAAYIEEAIAKGRARSEIIEALHFGVEAAIKLNDPIATARIATLMSHTVNRLDYHIDRRQLQRTLFALDEPDAALAAIAHEGQVYSVSQDTAEALIDLAVQGHEAGGRELAYGFFTGVTLILTLDSLSPFAEGNDVPRQRHRPFVRLAQQRPGAFKALTLTQRPQGENRLPSSCTPAHPRPFQALAHQGFTRGFHDPRANRQVLRSQGCIAHPVAMLTKIGQRFMDSLPTRVARPQATQRSHHGLDSFRRIAQYLA
jgi:hypothetical protein